MGFNIGISGATGVTGEIALLFWKSVGFLSGAFDFLHQGVRLTKPSTGRGWTIADPSVPLVIPEINAGDPSSHTGTLAGPNCTTAVAFSDATRRTERAGLPQLI